MRCERIRAADPGSTAARVRALVPDAQLVSEAVAEIIDGVRTRGDSAIREYTLAFDTGGAEPAALRADPRELAHAADELDPRIGPHVTDAEQRPEDPLLEQRHVESRHRVGGAE